MRPRADACYLGCVSVWLVGSQAVGCHLAQVPSEGVIPVCSLIYVQSAGRLGFADAQNGGWFHSTATGSAHHPWPASPDVIGVTLKPIESTEHV